MKRILLPTAALALSSFAAQAALVYTNDFEIAAVGSTPVGGTVTGATVVGGEVDILNSGSTVSTFLGAVPMGNVLSVSTRAEALDTNINLEGLGIDANTNYTVAAWLNSSSNSGDRMAIGSQSGAALHLGTRGNNYHSGHWGDDAGFGPVAPNLNEWAYVVWTNTAAGIQEIFVDGVSFGSAPGNTTTPAQNRNFNDLIIGATRLDQNRGFTGQIAGVQIYNEVLSPGDQLAIALAVAIPEPSRAALLGLAVLGLAFRRRR